VRGASLSGVHLRLPGHGLAVGEIVTVTTANGTQITWCYVTDPEGNIIELQATSWRDVQ
jgi:hypothetical protein